MAIYTVHAPPDADVSVETADRIRFVKDGFAFWALVFPLVWLVWHRLWLALLGYLAVAVAIAALGRFGDQTVATVVGVVFAFWFALEARGIRRWTYARRGWRLVGVVEGSSLEAAEVRFFGGWLRPAASDAATAAATVAPVPTRSYAESPGIIGLFPNAKGR